jgi:hypothetical protein
MSFSRPCGTGLARNVYTQHCVLGYSQSSRQAGTDPDARKLTCLFSPSAVQNQPIEKVNLDKSDFETLRAPRCIDKPDRGIAV